MTPEQNRLIYTVNFPQTDTIVKRRVLFKDTNFHDLFAFQSNSVFTPLLNGIPVSGHSLVSGRGHLKLKSGLYFAYAFSDTHK